MTKPKLKERNNLKNGWLVVNKVSVKTLQSFLFFPTFKSRLKFEYEQDAVCLFDTYVITNMFTFCISENYWIESILHL